MEKEFPQFLKYFPSYLRGKSFQYAHEQLLRSISWFYVNGYKNREVLKIEELFKCVKYIKTTYNKPNYPHVQDLVTYVFTSDEVMNPFGPWLEFEYEDLLYMYRFADDLNQRKGSSLQTKKLAGVIFGILSLSQLSKTDYPGDKVKELERLDAMNQYTDAGKKNKSDLRSLIVKYGISKDIVAIRNPSTLYSLANISRQQFIKYSEILEIEYMFEQYNTGGYKTTLWLANYKQLQEAFRSYKKENPIYLNIYEKVKRGVIHSGIDSLDTKECQEYERRYCRDSSSLFNYIPLAGNPLIRLHNHYKQVYIHTQLSLASFMVMFVSLYKELPLNMTVDNRKFFMTDIKKDKEEILARLRAANLHTEIHPVSTIRSKQKGRHFEQIRIIEKIIARISQVGIAIDLDNCMKLLKEFQAVQRYLQANPYDYDELSEEFFESESMLTPLDKSGFYVQMLKSVLSSTNDIRNNYDEHRIRGFFTANGASTHRMTCRDINLQGLPKKIKEHTIKAKKGSVLISLDVSGQDITVAANLAVKLFSDLQSFPKELHLEMNELYSKSLETLNKLKCNANEGSNTFKPIDHLTDLLHKKFPAKALKQTFFDNDKYIVRKRLRDMIKTSVYVFSYGGGLSAISNEYEVAETKKTIKLVLNNLEGASYHIQMLVKNRLENVKSYEELYSRLYNVFGILSTLYSDRIEPKDITRTLQYILDYQVFMTKRIKNRNKKIEVFNLVIKLIQKEYPGIIESFEYYRKYYEFINLTYPTFLGWQTVIVDVDKNYVKSRYTKSASYPIQASGAEFIRQWLIELSKVKGYAESWEIVNVIHDQVLIEVQNSDADRMKGELLNAAKEAAGVVGLDPATLHFSEPDVIGDELEPYFSIILDMMDDVG